MKTIRWAIPALFAFVVVLTDSPAALAKTVTVDCQANGDEDDEEEGQPNSINAALARLSKQGPHTLRIAGNCTELVLVDGFDSLTLVGRPGATLNAPADSDNSLLIIQQSRNVTVRDLTLNGHPDFAVASCAFFSHCTFHDVIVQGGDIGIQFARSRGTIGDNSVLQNNRVGAQVVVNSHVRFGAWPGNGGVTVQNNGNATDGGDGISIFDFSYADIFNSTVQDNDFGNGVIVFSGSFVGLLNSTVTGNGNDGISLHDSSVARLRTANTITANTGSGISLHDLTFLRMADGNTISGNGQPDVDCRKSTARTEGTGGSATPNLGGGTTNCTEPTP